LIAFSLRQGMKFDQRPPTNGRPLTAADVVASWEKFTAEAVYRTDIVNAASKTAPVLSLTATDPSTISLTLAFPDAQLLPSLNFWGGLWILPKEAHGGGLDPKTDMRGSGPWTLEKYTPSVGFSLKKNPNYYAAPQYPLMDGVELPIISDTAQAEAQFKAKNVIWGEFNSTVVPVTDILSIQSGVKDTRIDLGAPDVTGPSISFSWREGQPFKDERVRQAISMLIDRDTFIEVFYDLKNFQAAGVKMRGYWLAPYGAGYGPFWLDPKDAKFGASAKYLTYDVGEAKKLLAAAGHPNGFETTMTFVAGTTYGADWPQRAEALASMLAKGGIKASLNPIDYTSVWVPQYLRAHGDFDGMAMYPNGARGDPGQWLFVFLHSAGANNQAGTNFPDLDALIEKQRRELDRDKRIEIFHDIQRYCTAHMVIAPQGGHTESPALSWKGLHGPDEYHPWPGNQSFGVELVPYFWTDDTLRG
jgi:peptide/nickel transport system substrate-binding protein